MNRLRFPGTLVGLLLSASAAAATVDVLIVDFAFQPANVAINAGDTVRWTNNGAFLHSSTSDTGIWDSGLLTTGQSFTRVFDAAGTFRYHCSSHLFMLGTVTVNAPAGPAPPVIASALTVAATVNLPFSFTLTATGSPPIAFSATGLPPGLTLTGNIISGTPTATGTFAVTLQATNGAGTDTETLTITIGGGGAGGGPAPPVILGLLIAGGTVGLPFGYTITASGTEPMTFTASGLPAALRLDGAVISGTPAVAGQFFVTLQAANSVGTNSNILTINIASPAAPAPVSERPPPPVFISNTKTDSDGDGFPDEIEFAVGTSPANAASTPFDGSPAGTPVPLPLAKLRIGLRFGIAGPGGTDSIAASGVLPVPTGLPIGGQRIVVDIGGVVRSFTLDQRGAARAGNDSFQLRVRSVQGSVLDQSAKFSVTLRRGVFSPLLEDEGLLGNSDLRAVLRTVPVVILFNRQVYQVDQTQFYSATAGRTGRTK
jgi:plastocyanin